PGAALRLSARNAVRSVSTLRWWRSAVNRSFFLCLAACRTRLSAWVTRFRLWVRCVVCWSAFPLAPALGSTASAAGGPALFGDFTAVESGEVGLIALPPPARSNGSCSFPASRFPMWVALIGEGWVVFQGRGRSAARGRSLRWGMRRDIGATPCSAIVY